MTVVYNEASIKRLKGLEGVRLRTSMYVPTTEHPHHLFKEVITNSVDERLVGFGDTIIVQKKGSAITVRDFGRGIPFGLSAEEGISTLTLVATELHAGGKFSDNTYKVSGGLFGVGLSVVNALSSFLHIQSFRDNQTGWQQFSRGIPTTEVICNATTEPNGTLISYIPDETIFNTIDSNIELLLQEIYFIVCLNNIKVVCDFDGKQLTLQDMNISTLIDKFSLHKAVEIPEYTYDHSVFFRFAFALSDGTNSRKFLFVNGVPVQKGNFLKIFFNSFAYYLGQAGLKFDGKDLHDTINLVLSIKAPVNIISFKGQVKEYADINYSSMRQIFDYLFAFVFNSKSFQKLLKTQYKKAFTILLKRRKQDDEINKAFKELKKADSNSDSNLIVLPGKLTDCQAQNTGELFLVEGESIGYNTSILYNDKNGYLKFNWVSEIYDQEIFVDSLNLGFYNIESKRVQGVIKHNAKNKKMFRITSQGGYPLDISNNHCIWVYNTKNQAFIEKDPEHIILKEDCLVSNKTLQSPNIDCIELDISSQLIDFLKVDKSLHSYISIDSSEFDWGTNKGRIKLIGESLNFIDQMTQVAKKIGVKYSSLVHFNKGAHRISISSFRKLCKHMYIRSSKYTKFRVDLEPIDSNKKYLQCTSSVIYSQVSDKIKALIRKITITEEIAYLIGQYLGDGYLSFKKGGNTSPYIGLCLGEDNHLASVEISKIVQDLNFCDGDPYLVEPSITNKTLIIHSIELHALLYHLGLTKQVQVYDKFIPDIFFNCNVKIRNELLRGLYLSDGYLNLNRNYYKLGFESTSLKLAQGMFLLHRLDNRLPVWQETSPKKAVICGNSCNTRGNFRVVINRLEDLYAIEDICKRFVSYNEEIFYREREIRKSSRIILNTNYPDLIFLPIKEVKPIDYANPFIYDLSIKDNENFPSGIHGAIIHNSASGSGKQARDRKFQAILPLKGKVLNVLKSNYATTMKNEVIQDLMIAIGISIKGKNIVINPRYNKIILSVDADSVSENTDIVFINSENLIDCKKVKDISKDEIKYVFSLNPVTNNCEIKEVLDVISHDYDKGFINKVTVYGNHSEEYTDDHMLFLYDKVEQKVKQVSPLDIEINRHLFLATECQFFLNKKFNIDITDHLFNVVTKNSDIRIRINSNDFDWKTLNGRINIGGRVRYINTTRVAVARKLEISEGVLQMYDIGGGNTKAPLSIINELQKLTTLDLKDSVIDLYFTYENKRYIELGFVIKISKENNRIRTSISITKELAYIIGAYLGNGFWGSSKNNPYEIIICCGEKLYLYDKLKSCCHRYGFIQTVKDDIGTTDIKIRINSVELCALLDYFGLIRSVHCDAKFIPKIFFSCEEEVRVWLLMGLYDTDGCLSLYNTKRYRLSYSSTSLQLINDLLLMLKQFSVVGSFILRDNIGEISGYVNGKPIIHRKIAYLVNINHREDLLKLKQVFEHRPGFNINYITQVKFESNFTSIGKGTILLPIRKVERVSYASNKVYDLSVKDNQTFSCGIQGLNIHNSDGSHIRTLLLAFFLKWGRPLIEYGHIYVSRLPIYLVRNKRLGSRFVYEEHLFQKKKGDVISRFKGLGEMNPDELETTLFNPQTRKLEQVKITNLAEAATIFQALMGSESEMRTSFLQHFSTEFDHINLDL